MPGDFRRPAPPLPFRALGTGVGVGGRLLSRPAETTEAARVPGNGVISESRVGVLTLLLVLLVVRLEFEALPNSCSACSQWRISQPSGRPSRSQIS